MNHYKPIFGIIFNTLSVIILLRVNSKKLEIQIEKLVMIKLFNEHPASVNESYFEHMGVALSFFIHFCYAAFAALVHAFLPFLFVKTGSKIITELNQRMVLSRQRIK